MDQEMDEAQDALIHEASAVIFDLYHKAIQKHTEVAKELNDLLAIATDDQVFMEFEIFSQRIQANLAQLSRNTEDEQEQREKQIVNLLTKIAVKTKCDINWRDLSKSSVSSILTYLTQSLLSNFYSHSNEEIVVCLEFMIILF